MPIDGEAATSPLAAGNTSGISRSKVGHVTNATIPAAAPEAAAAEAGTTQREWLQEYNKGAYATATTPTTTDGLPLPTSHAPPLSLL